MVKFLSRKNITLILGFIVVIIIIISSRIMAQPVQDQFENTGTAKVQLKELTITKLMKVTFKL